MVLQVDLKSINIRLLLIAVWLDGCYEYFIVCCVNNILYPGVERGGGGLRERGNIVGVIIRYRAVQANTSSSVLCTKSCSVEK